MQILDALPLRGMFRESSLPLRFVVSGDPYLPAALLGWALGCLVAKYFGG
jgi:hypothetical protein